MIPQHTVPCIWASIDFTLNAWNNGARTAAQSVFERGWGTPATDFEIVSSRIIPNSSTATVAESAVNGGEAIHTPAVVFESACRMISPPFRYAVADFIISTPR